MITAIIGAELFMSVNFISFIIISFQKYWGGTLLKIFFGVSKDKLHNCHLLQFLNAYLGFVIKKIMDLQLSVHFQPL